MIKATNSISLTVTQMNKEINWTLVDVKNIPKDPWYIINLEA